MLFQSLRYLCDHAQCTFPTLLQSPTWPISPVIIVVVVRLLLLLSLQSCPTLCDPTDGSPLGSSVAGILQTRTLEWVAISFSIAWKWKVKAKSLSCVRLLVTPWTSAYQAPPSMGFSRQEYWSEVPLPSLNKHIQLFVTPWTAACQVSLSPTISQNLLKLMSIELVMPSNHLILCCPLLLPLSIFPIIRVFTMTQFFALNM